MLESLIVPKSVKVISYLGEYDGISYRRPRIGKIVILGDNVDVSGAKFGGTISDINGTFPAFSRLDKVYYTYESPDDAKDTFTLKNGVLTIYKITSTASETPSWAVGLPVNHIVFDLEVVPETFVGAWFDGFGGLEIPYGVKNVNFAGCRIGNIVLSNSVESVILSNECYGSLFVSNSVKEITFGDYTNITQITVAGGFNGSLTFPTSMGGYSYISGWFTTPTFDSGTGAPATLTLVEETTTYYPYTL